MLYDQAMLAMAYTEAYQATGEEEHERTAREIFTYVLRDMTTPEGGFCSAEDAESEGEEGKFYLWTEEEIQHLLGPEEAKLIIGAFNIDRDGNLAEEATGKRTGANILHLTTGPGELASHLKMSEQDLQARLEAARRILFTYRDKRVRPHKDDKILTDWNGLMIAALAKGAQLFDDPNYADAAKRAVDFILKNMQTADGRLLHRYRDGQAEITANLDDHAFLVWGLIELYEATFDTGYLRAALELNDDMLRHFWDDEDGGLYFTPDDGEKLLVRKKEIYDGAIPSGNSVAMLNLLRLGRMTADSALEDKAAKIGRAFGGHVERSPSVHTQLLVAVDFGVGPSYEVVIAGDPESEDTKTMLRALRTRFMPNKIVLLRPSEGESDEITRLAEFAKYQSSISSKATAYVCVGHRCDLPTTEIQRMLELLDAKQLSKSRPPRKGDPCA